MNKCGMANMQNTIMLILYARMKNQICTVLKLIMMNHVLTTSRKAVAKMTEIIVASADIIIAIFMLLIAFGGKQKGAGILYHRY